MSAGASWEEGNARYLAAALAWLRLRLEQLAGEDGVHPVALDSARAERDLCESQMDPPPALVLLAERFGLSRFEADVLLLCAATELDTRVCGLCERAQSGASKPHPTYALALALFDDAAWDLLSPERPLRRWRLVEAHRHPALPLTTSPLSADERIVNYLKGLNHLDDRLNPLLTPMPQVDTAELDPSRQALVDQLLRTWQGADLALRRPSIQLVGPDVAAKRIVAQRAAAHFGCCLYRIDADTLPSGFAELDALARLWQRECLLLPVALYVDGVDRATDAAARSALVRFLARCDGLSFVDVREPLPHLRHDCVTLDVPRPATQEQCDAWARALGPLAGDSAARLSSQFNLDTQTIRRLAAKALATTPEDAAAAAPVLWDACKAAARPALDGLAHRIDARAGWTDIVLPPDRLAMLRQIGDQVQWRGRVYDEWGFADRMTRGLGISALFDGASGVGKTMAAEIIANDLGLDLYRIDLSAVVSKYIGETEANLRRLFDAADDGGAILFFDECDALFGKRSEVRDSHDRYANIEINYLLQRIEAYRGLAVLATNMRSALDTAFVRRLRFIINFPFPGPAERRQIWQKAFPGGVPLARLDYERLASINLTGGSIHAAALGAAFLAARAGADVDMPCVLAAVRTEFVKLGRPISESDFLQ